MRKVIASEFLSLDGVMEAPDQWHFPYFNDEMGEAVVSQMAESDTMLLGRRTYEEFAGLLDELRLLVHPIVVGYGRRLFPEGSDQQPLKLVESKTFSTGVLYVTYQ